MSKVTVIEGIYAKKPVINQVFDLVKAVQLGTKGHYVTVDGTNITGQAGRNIRIYLEGSDMVEYHGVEKAESQSQETKEQALDRIKARFDILDQMTDAVARGIVRGMIVSGPPGVGKSFGVEKILDEYEAMNKLSGEKFDKVEVVKGSMTPIGLYQTLYNMKDRGDILVFDDCDSILFDEVCLNMLKAVLDSGKKRKISWKSESAALRREGIPDSFDFAGGCIFITNVNFENVRSKKIQDHLAALQSRCHYIDLEMDSESDRFMRIDQIVRDGMLDEYNFGDEGNQEVIQFLKDNVDRLRELSLRTVLKIADLKAMSKDNWMELAKSTCLKRVC